MKTGTKYVLVLLGVALAIGGITFLNRADNGNGKLVNKVDLSVRPVQTLVATPTRLVENVERTGVLEARRDVILIAEVAGKVRRVERDLGDRCNEGNTLIALDSEAYRIALQEAQASLKQAHAGLAEAERTLERAEKLEARKLASDQDLDRARSAVESNRAATERAEAGVALATRNLRESTVRCPFAGVVAERMVDIGRLVGPQTPLVRLVDDQSLKLTLTVSAAELSRLRVGQPVSLTDPSIPDGTYRGEIARLGVAADPATRTFPVEVTVASGPRPGQVVRAIVRVAVHERAIAVPADAVTFTDNGPRAFVVRDGIAVEKSLRLGPRIGDEVIVEAGIAAGDRVIVVGVHGLQSGDQVKPMDRTVDTNSAVAGEARPDPPGSNSAGSGSADPSPPVELTEANPEPASQTER